MTALMELVEQVKVRRALPPPSERRKIREDAGVSQADLGRVVGCTEAAVSAWERGIRTPRRDLLTAYLDALRALKAETDAA